VVDAWAAIDATAEARHVAGQQQKGAGIMPAPKLDLRLVALGCSQAPYAPAEGGAAYIFLAFFFAFFAMCSSCASDTSCKTPTQKTKLQVARAAIGFCQKYKSFEQVKYSFMRILTSIQINASSAGSKHEPLV
jgi:hypothetical protein